MNTAAVLRALTQRTSDTRCAILGYVAGCGGIADQEQCFVYIGGERRRFENYIRDLRSQGCLDKDQLTALVLMPVEGWRGAQTRRLLPQFTQEMLVPSDDLVRARASEVRDEPPALPSLPSPPWRQRQSRPGAAAVAALAPAPSLLPASCTAYCTASGALASEALSTDPKLKAKAAPKLRGLSNELEIRTEAERAIGPALRHPHYGPQWFTWLDHHLDLVEYALEEMKNKSARETIRNPAAFLARVIRDCQATAQAQR